MSCLAESYLDEPSPLGSQAIADARELAKPTVAKILTILSQFRLVNGTPGPKGGYWLAKPPSEISLLDIVSVFENTEGVPMCPFGPNWCGNGNSCPLHEDYLRLNQTICDFLRNKKLDVFAKESLGN